MSLLTTVQNEPLKGLNEWEKKKSFNQSTKRVASGETLPCENQKQGLLSKTHLTSFGSHHKYLDSS